MNKSFSATYHDSANRIFEATIYLSSITVSIRYQEKDGMQRDVYWLAENIVSLEENPTQSILIHRNIDGSMDKLVFSDNELLLGIKKNFRHHKFIGGFYYHVMGNTRNKIFLFLAFFLSLILVAYLWLVPWIGVKIAENFSKDYEISIGETIYGSFVENYKTDSTKTAILNLFYKELNFNSSYPINITVVESEETNAFAIPGGNIVVFDAILDEMKTPEELAALLAHETSHIELRHSLKNLFRSVARKMFLTIVVGSESGIASFLADNADDLKGLEYSRSLETEADNNGLQLMLDNEIDHRGMMRLMELLQNQTKGEEPAAFLSTHPLFKKRIENIRNKIQQWPPRATKNPILNTIFHQIYE